MRFRPFLLEVAAHFPDQHDGFCLRILLEPCKHVHEGLADDRVAANPDNGALADAGPGELVHDLVGERARAGDDPHIPAGEEAWAA